MMSRSVINPECNKRQIDYAKQRSRELNEQAKDLDDEIIKYLEREFKNKKIQHMNMSWLKTILKYLFDKLQLRWERDFYRSKEVLLSVYKIHAAQIKDELRNFFKNLIPNGDGTFKFNDGNEAFIIDKYGECRELFKNRSTKRDIKRKLIYQTNPITINQNSEEITQSKESNLDEPMTEEDQNESQYDFTFEDQGNSFQTNPLDFQQNSDETIEKGTSSLEEASTQADFQYNTLETQLSNEQPNKNDEDFQLFFGVDNSDDIFLYSIH